MAEPIGEFNPLCQEGADVYFTIDSRDIDGSGIARKVLDSNQCLTDVEILNGVAREVVLQFESSVAKISGKWELENAGKLTIESKGGLEIQELNLENVRELKIQDSGGNQKALIKGVRV